MKGKYVIMFFLIIVLLSAATSKVHAATLEETFVIEKAAQYFGIVQSEITAVHKEELNLPLTQRQLTAVKVLTKDGKDRWFAFNEALNAIDVDALIQAESEAKNERYGKVEPALHESLVLTSDTPRLVHIYTVTTPELEQNINVRSDLQHAKKTTEKATYDAQMDSLKAEQFQIAEAVLQPVVDEIARLGGQVEYIFQATHSLTAWLTPGQILEIQNLPQVTHIYDNEKYFQQDVNVMWRTLGVATYWRTPVQANGLNIAVVELGAVKTTNRPYISNVLAVRDSSCPSDHTTQVACTIGCDQDHWSGIARLADIVNATFCSGTYSEAQTAMQWALTNYDPQVYNHSYGSTSSGVIDSSDQYLDQFAYDNQETQVKSAGNYPSTCDSNYYVGHPGLGYNTVTVGAFDDGDSVPRGNDTMASFSCYQDPPGRTKPDVAAPGVDITWYMDGPPRSGNPPLFQTNSGTSFAAPAVTGLLGLFQDKGNCALFSSPQTHRAALMAAAIFNPGGETGLKGEYDGAGGVDGGLLEDIGRRGGAACDQNSATDDQNHYYYLEAGQTIRAVLAWDENPTGAHRSGLSYPDYPQGDLDLKIYAPGGALVTSSTSARDTFEIVEFAVSTAGQYRFNVNFFNGPFPATIRYAVVHVAK